MKETFMKINRIWPAIAIVAMLVGCSGMATVSDTAGGPLIDDQTVINATNRIENAAGFYLDLGTALHSLRQNGLLTNNDLWARIQQADEEVDLGLKEAMAALDAYMAHRSSGTTDALQDALAALDHVLSRLRLHKGEVTS
jgi:hypothetical protein